MCLCPPVQPGERRCSSRCDRVHASRHVPLDDVASLGRYRAAAASNRQSATHGGNATTSAAPPHRQGPPVGHLPCAQSGIQQTRRQRTDHLKRVRSTRFLRPRLGHQLLPRYTEPVVLARVNLMLTQWGF